MPVGLQKGANRAPRVRTEPADRRPPEVVFAWLSDVGNLPEYLPPWWPPRRRALGRERPRPEDQGDARVPGGGGANLRRRGLPRRGREGTQNGVGRGGRTRLLRVAYGREPRRG